VFQVELPDLEWGTYGDSFGHRVITLRKARGFSQERLGQLSGMHRNQISNIERNVSSKQDKFSDPHLSTVYKIARALDVHPSLLIPDGDRSVKVRSPEQATQKARSAVESALLEALERLGEH
jgi:transcriptional regulator with XRE-family HTH domain